MSGGRFSTYREGDRSEYLARYVLSALGLVTEVPRQEDIGFDFVCSVADNEDDFLTFQHQYVVSAKSIGQHQNIVLSPSKSWDGEVPPHIDWLFGLDLPLIVAVVDKPAGTVYLFTTLPMFFIQYECYRECGAVTLKPRIMSDNTDDVGRPKKGKELEKWPGKYHYEVDLGHPAVIITIDDLTSKKRLIEIKDRLRYVLRIAQSTIRLMRMGAPYFYWFAVTDRDAKEYRPAWCSQNLPEHGGSLLYQLQIESAPLLTTLAMYYQQKGKGTLVTYLCEILKEVPPDVIPQPIRDILKLPKL